jgi:myosin heavy subunit
LQLEFNHYILQLEQKEYRERGIDVSEITFTDNSDCIDSFEQSPLAIMYLLDEEARFLNGTDRSLVHKVVEHHSSYPYLARDRFSPVHFVVQHFAAPVRYEATGFLEKVRDQVSNDMLAIFQDSSDPLLSSLMQASIN